MGMGKSEAYFTYCFEHTELPLFYLNLVDSTVGSPTEHDLSIAGPSLGEIQLCLAGGG